MKEAVKLTKTGFAVFMIMSILSGMMIGIGGSASLLETATLGSGGKLIGAILFTLGIFAIITFEMRLFTGMVANIPTMGLKNTWKLPVCFLGNIIGVGILALLVSQTAISEPLITLSTSISDTKLAGNWFSPALCSSILCGNLITLSVWSVNHSPRKGLNATLGVIFPIVLFAFCGFDHSVAYMFYFYLSGAYIHSALEVIGYEAVCILGNLVGGLALPLAHVLKEHSKKHRPHKTNDTSTNN